MPDEESQPLAAEQGQGMVDLEKVLERIAAQKSPGTPLETSQRAWHLTRVKLQGKTVPPTAIFAAGPVEDWLAVRDTLRAAGFTVPELYACSRERGQLLVEDLGQNRLIDLPPAEAARRYEESLSLILQMQRLLVPGKHTDHPPFSRALNEAELIAELDAFVDEALPKIFGVPSRGAHVEPIRIEFARLARDITSMPRLCAHRSFTGRNLHVTAGKRLVMTGFDRALMAPPHYDLASLLYDGWGGPEASRREDLLRRHTEEGKEFLPAWDEEALSRAFGRVAVQRILAEFGRIATVFAPEKLAGLKHVTDALTQNLRKLCQSNDDLAMIREPLADLLPIFRS
ncbi:MAG: phosphotransferase [Planctomycetes bacterium]|nr:phosphotransferase [Planctomycetota bacterium]